MSATVKLKRDCKNGMWLRVDAGLRRKSTTRDCFRKYVLHGVMAEETRHRQGGLFAQKLASVYTIVQNKTEDFWILSLSSSVLQKKAPLIANVCRKLRCTPEDMRFLFPPEHERVQN